MPEHQEVEEWDVFLAWKPPSDDWEYAERIIAEIEEMNLMH